MVGIKNILNVLGCFDVLAIDLHNQIAADVDGSIAQISALASAPQSGPIGGATRRHLLNQDTGIGSKSRPATKGVAPRTVWK